MFLIAMEKKGLVSKVRRLADFCPGGLHMDQDQVFRFPRDIRTQLKSKIVLTKKRKKNSKYVFNNFTINYKNSF